MGTRRDENWREKLTVKHGRKGRIFDHGKRIKYRLDGRPAHLHSLWTEVFQATLKRFASTGKL